MWPIQEKLQTFKSFVTTNNGRIVVSQRRNSPPHHSGKLQVGPNVPTKPLGTRLDYDNSHSEPGFQVSNRAIFGPFCSDI
jgi:hypothetical protein